MPVREYKWREFGQRLKAARQRAELTQQRVAEHIGVQTQTVWYWESGRSKPTYERLARLAGLLDVTVDSLLIGTDVLLREGSPTVPANRVRYAKADPSVDEPAELPPVIQSDVDLEPQAWETRGVEAHHYDRVLPYLFSDPMDNLVFNKGQETNEATLALRAALPNISDEDVREIADHIRHIEDRAKQRILRYDAREQPMLIFLGESGVPGLNVTDQSSPYFVAALLIFDEDQALVCKGNIDRLRLTQTLGPDYVFDFYENSDRIRTSFLKVVSDSPFQYYLLALNQDPSLLTDPRFFDEDSLCQFTAEAIFRIAWDDLVKCKVVIDQGRRSPFQRQVQEFVRSMIADRTSRRMIAEAIPSDRYRDNLLQLADYVADVSSCFVRDDEPGRTLWDTYLVRKATNLRIWPAAQVPAG